MKVSEIPIKNEIDQSEIKSGYTLGMKNVYPNDKVPVFELQRFPLTAYLSDIDMNSTKQLIQRMRTISSDVNDQKKKLEDIVSNIKTVTLTDISAAKLQPLKDVVSYDEVTSVLTSKFASPEELQTTVYNVYSKLFSAVEEMMVQVFTTSMYARQYVSINDPEIIE